MNQKGFTLIETLIYMALISMVLVSLMVFIIYVSETRQKAYIMHEVQVSNREILQTITSLIKQAQAVNVDNCTFNTDPGVLVLAMADSSINPTIISLDNDDGVLQISQGSNSPVNISSPEISIKQLIFENLSVDDSNQNIRININTEYNSSDDSVLKYGQSWQTAVSLRN